MDCISNSGKGTPILQILLLSLFVWFFFPQSEVTQRGQGFRKQKNMVVHNVGDANGIKTQLVMQK